MVIWLQFQTTPTYTVVKTVLPPVSNLAESTPMDFSNINWLAVFVASLSSFVIGAVWFGPKTFYPIWIKAQGREVPVSEGKSSAAEMALMFGGTYVGALAQVATLAVILELQNLLTQRLVGQRVHSLALSLEWAWERLRRYRTDSSDRRMAIPTAPSRFG